VGRPVTSDRAHRRRGDALGPGAWAQRVDSGPTGAAVGWACFRGASCAVTVVPVPRSSALVSPFALVL